MSHTSPPAPRPPDGDEPLLGPVMRAADGRPPAGACPDADVLALYADHELAAGEVRVVEQHVAGCGRCQAVVAAVVRSTPPAGAAADPVGAAVPWWAGWRWMLPVAATASIVAVALWIGPSPSEQVADSARRADSAALKEEEAAGVPVARPGANLEPQQERQADSETFTAASPRPRARPPAAAPVAPPPVAADAQASVNARLAEPPAAVPASPAVRPEAPEAASVPQRAELEPSAPVPAPAPAPATAAATGTTKAIESRGAAFGGIARAAAQADLRGTVTYRTRGALPAGAVVEVRLLDVSRADAPAITLARATVVTAGEQVPIPFTLHFPAGAIQPRGRYAVEATIAVDGRPAWRTTSRQPVFAGGDGATPVSLVLDAVR